MRSTSAESHSDYATISGEVARDGRWNATDVVALQTSFQTRRNARPNRPTAAVGRTSLLAENDQPASSPLPLAWRSRQSAGRALGLLVFAVFRPPHPPGNEKSLASSGRLKLFLFINHVAPAGSMIWSWCAMKNRLNRRVVA
uniref:Uncharacterized protein n=1 Tax=Plectus sambesii TaxID=2011161 RepID=A0A914VGA3_9BILA